MLHWAYSRPEVREVLNGASLCYPDGIAAAKLAGWELGKDVERVSGPSFILKACEQGISKGWRHFFLGGKPGVAEELAKTLAERYPGLQVVGTCCPPFRDMSDAEIEALCQELQEKKVDLLWVALGGPRQEIWMHRYLGRIPVPVMLGVGAAFDFHTSHQSWAPKWVRAIGMEWLWRLCTGGKRVFVRNVICVSHVACRLLLAAIGRIKYLFIKHAVPQSRKIKCGVNASCDGMPCSSSTPYCPYFEDMQKK
ncbi:MAG: putative N-acetylmannosaminyltransferase [Lentisphaerae bacterium ADurb.Bin082]|nr:MAG: putative N-acetylmannosaminyltransferase [Lentisphaerae bacterium ADurb.Bin082]